jgi:hypothetical protein
LDRRPQARPEDDDFADDQIASDPLRSPNSAIRYQPPQPSQPATGQHRGETLDTRVEKDTTRQQAPGGSSSAFPHRAGRISGASPGTIPARAGRGAATGAPSPQQHPPRRSMHWLMYVGIGMVAAIALWVSFSAILAWGTTEFNNIFYGYPRFYQTDAVVGHGDSTAHPSHFIALNLHGQVIVIELPAGNPSKSYEYIGPDLIANGDDQIPITLSFSDVNHDGRPDMIIHILDHEVIFCNDGTKFTQCSS